MKPSDFTIYLWGSVCEKSECETIAFNIMVILKRTGNVFRQLSFDEYKEERKRDGNFTTDEEEYFHQVIDYCKSAETARLFSKTWKNIS